MIRCMSCPRDILLEFGTFLSQNTEMKNGRMAVPWKAIRGHVFGKAVSYDGHSSTPKTWATHHSYTPTPVLTSFSGSSSQRKKKKKLLDLFLLMTIITPKPHFTCFFLQSSLLKCPWFNKLGDSIWFKHWTHAAQKLREGLVFITSPPESKWQQDALWPIPVECFWVINKADKPGRAS